MQPVGIPLPDDMLEQLDEKKRDWDRREASAVSRSEVAREALAIGIAALDELDKQNRHLSTRERRAITRQGIIDHFEAEAEAEADMADDE